MRQVPVAVCMADSHVWVDRSATLVKHRSWCTIKNPLLHSTLALTSARESDVGVVWLFCLDFSRLLKGLMDAAVERRSQLFLLLSSPIHHPSIVSFHSPAPLLLSHTSLALSLFEPTNLLLSPLFFGPHFYSSLAPLLGVTPHRFGCLSQRCLLAAGSWLAGAAKGCSPDLLISHHSFVTKRHDHCCWETNINLDIADGAPCFSSVRPLT